DKVQLGNALKKLAKETGTSLIVDSRVAKEAEAAITLQLDDVPLETAVRLMAESAGLKPVRVGNVLFVTNKANAKELKADQEQGGATPTPLPGTPGGLTDRDAPVPINPIPKQ